MEERKITKIGIGPSEKNERMSWGLAFALAMSLWNISKEQDNQRDRIVSYVNDEELQKQISIQLSNIVGRFVSSIILKSFSIEIFLKFLSFKETGKFIGTHDLKKLYDNLGDKTKKVIVDISIQQSVKPIEQIIESHKNDFTKWRYAFEDDDMIINDLTELDNVLEVLRLAEKKMYNTKFSAKSNSSEQEIISPLG